VAVATPHRREDGRLASGLPVDVLIRVVRAIAEDAARAWAGAITAPWEVKTGQWNTARLRWAGVHGVDVPEAKNVLRTLRNAFRDPTLSWPTLLAVIFFEETDPRRALASRAAHLRAAVTRDAAYWSLNLVALNAGVCTFTTIAAYDAARLRLIRSRRGPRRIVLLRYLVEGVDIAKVCDGWANALDGAGLSPSPEMTVEIRRSTPIADMQLIHFAETGVFGSVKEVRALAKRLGTRMAALCGREWHEHVEDARALVLGRGLPAPPPYGAPPPSIWERIPVDTSVRPVERSEPVTRAEAREAIRRAQDWLPSGQPLTEPDYRAYEHEHADAPSLKMIRAHGTISDLQADLVGLTTPAKRHSRNAPRRQPDRLIERRRSKHARSLESETLVTRRSETVARDAMVLDLVRTEGELSVAEIIDRLGWKRSATNYAVGRLVEAGQLERTQTAATSRNQRYRVRRKRRTT
jgi:hypothetical protein